MLPKHPHLISEEIEEEGYYKAERSFGAFERSVSLPEPVVVEKVTATYEAGVLEITLPKLEPKKAKEAVKVAIK